MGVEQLHLVIIRVCQIQKKKPWYYSAEHYLHGPPVVQVRNQM